MERCAIIHYHEIGLKGKNRPFFEKLLKRNVERSLAGLPVGQVTRLPGRLVVDLQRDVDQGALRQRLRSVFGIAYFALGYHVSLSMDDLRAGILATLPRRDGGPFRISARRSNKEFRLNSQEIDAELGAAVQSDTGWDVDLTDPALEVFVEVLYRHAYFYFEKLDGPGGLPVGSSGVVACMISGGIDSPVAAYHMLKRGCEPFYVHFHSGPFGTRQSREKVVELVRILSRYQGPATLYTIPFGEIQQEVVLTTPGEYRVVLYRRLMARITERLAQKKGAKALITGEAVGQVASQTLENLGVVDVVPRLPILRPLIGMDKQEIIDQARVIDTYEISIMPGEDCCQFFVPRHPVTRASLEDVESIESRLDVQRLVDKGIADAKRQEVKPEMAESAPEDTPEFALSR